MEIISGLFSGKNKKFEQIIKTTTLFMEASMFLVTELDEDEMQIAMGYELGVLDALAQISGFDQDDAIKVMTKYFKEVKSMPVNQDSVRHLYGVFVSSEEGLNNIKVGGNAVNSWIKGDKNAPLKLLALLNAEE